MKKVVLATFLACAVASSLPSAFAQDASSGAQAAPAAPAATDPCAAPPMAAAEYAVYNNAMTQTDLKAQAAALEQYLTQFPQSAVKANTLERIMALYAQTDGTKAGPAADRVLQVDPNDITALYLETLIHKGQADAIKDATAQQAELDTAAGYAQKALAATKPACMTDADFNTKKTTFYPTFYSVIGYAAFNKKDSATAIDAYKKELAFVPLAATQTVGSPLADTFYLGQAYMQATPPDYLSCAFYASRALAYAPDNFKATISGTAKYCYHQYHGRDDDGYDGVMAAATANLNPPAGFAATVKPAPTPADIVNQVIATTPDLNTLAVGDKEYILQNGTPDQAAKVWDLLKGKSYQLPDVLVIASTATQLQVAVSEDAKQSKTADFTINLAASDDADKKLTPLQAKAAATKAAAIAAATAVGATTTVAGTYDSFTPNPIMITMKDGEVILPKAAAPKPVAHPAAHKPVAH